MAAEGTVPEVVQALPVDFVTLPFKKARLLRRIQDSIEWDSKVREAYKCQEERMARMARLTPREREVMALVVRGKLNKLITSELGISIKTVEVHRVRVMRKLQVKRQADLVHFAMGYSSQGKYQNPPGLIYSGSHLGGTQLGLRSSLNGKYYASRLF